MLRTPQNNIRVFVGTNLSTALCDHNEIDGHLLSPSLSDAGHFDKQLAAGIGVPEAQAYVIITCP